MSKETDNCFCNGLNKIWKEYKTLQLNISATDWNGCVFQL